ncbi:hypothetical protein IQ283_15765 [Alkalihalobacillus hwajinpoensis]|uniref:hypothetical protein n=1 Tax=Guptibacillus hwajinpoensis TaxID=208199 RepID=UPI001883FEDA|nr:hypothetical protein [Pseudalkalibacillus hwajinpoensis]MBF0708056.1 hypothetical protein [Pseudalkalibacillus hwajinpoensis]
MKSLLYLSRKLNSRLTPSIWFLSVVIFALFLAFILPEVSERSYEATGTSDSPDGSFFYTPEKLYSVAEQYGESGRSYYIKERFSFDIIWPLVYWFFLTTSITVLFRSISNEKWLLLNLLPAFGVLFDYLENISTSAVMYSYPTTFPFISWSAPFLTSIKWSCIYASFLLILIGGLLRFIRVGKKMVYKFKN